MTEVQDHDPAMLDDRDRHFADRAAFRTDLAVSLGPLRLANPVMPASGCFGPELAALLPVHELGALVTKTLFSQRRSGNPSHRLTESTQGMLNSVGIPSPGSAEFIRTVLPRYRSFGVPVVVSVGGLAPEEYLRITEELADAPCEALEVNVSCPNLEHGGLTIGTDASTVERVVSGVVARTSLPVIVKLTPNVTSIGDIARASEQAGATAVTVANTFPGMAIDLNGRSAVLGNGVGGLSGPAVRPMVLRLVWQAAAAVAIPVVACGGISTARDVLEFVLAGATAVQMGTATFTRPYAMTQVLRDLEALCRELGITRLADERGTVRT